MTPQHRLAVEIMYFDYCMPVDRIAYDAGWPVKYGVRDICPVIREALKSPDVKSKRRRKIDARQGQKLCYKGEELTIEQWSKRTGLSHQTIRHRIRAGWDAWSILHTRGRKPKEAA